MLLLKFNILDNVVAEVRVSSSEVFLPFKKQLNFFRYVFLKFINQQAVASGGIAALQ